jgi:hypothetical protein
MRKRHLQGKFPSRAAARQGMRQCTRHARRSVPSFRGSRARTNLPTHSSRGWGSFSIWLEPRYFSGLFVA